MAEGRSSTIKILVAVIVVAALALVGLVTLAVVTRTEPDSLDSPPDTGARTSESSTTMSPTTDPGPSSTSTTTPPQVDLQERTVQMGLLQREYLTVAPKDVQPGEQLPVVVALHGLGVDRSAMLNAADWRGAVERDRFLAVFPQGVANSWNLGPCCLPASLLGIDDLGFLDTVVNEVSARPDVDDERLYLSGFSNGGVMAYWVVCSRPGTYAAVAPMSGSNLTGCRPTEPISLLHQHSDPDPVVPFDGQIAIGQLISSADFPPVTESVAAWAAADGCPSQPEVTQESSGVERTEWAPCGDGTRVELVRLPGVGHNWPNLGEYDGMTEMLEFFDLE